MSVAKAYNAISDFVDCNVDNGFGDKPAFIDPLRTLTYKELQSASNKMANLLGQLGIAQKSRIALLMFDTIDFPIAYWGAIRAGVVPVCLNTLLTTDQYEYLLSDSHVEALFVSVELLPLVAPILEKMVFLKHIVVVGEGSHDHLVFQDLLNRAKPDFSTAKTHSDDIAFWLYSSGSTGEPKGVMHRHSSLIHVAKYFGQGVLNISHDDVCFAAAKLFFAYAQGAAMAIPMSVGATTILMPGRPTPGSILATLHRFNPTIFFGVPTLYATMLADADCQPKNASNRLRLCVSAGEALPQDLGQSWRDRMGIDIIDGVGSTEMLNAFLSNRPGEVRYGTSGREFDGYKLRLVDDEDNDIDADTIGELLVLGGSSAEGYWNKPEKSRDTFQGKWVRTGDKYYRDKDGYYHYCGRTNDMFKVSGRWVSPFEVEQALVSYPAVLEAAVVARKDDKGLIKPKAFVVLKKSHHHDGLFEILKTHVKTSVGVWKYPRWIDFVDDLPKTATGKIQRYKLRE